MEVRAPRHIVAAVAAAMLLPGLVPATGVRAACCPGPERFWRACTVTWVTSDSLAVRFAEDATTDTFALGSVALRNAAVDLRRRGDAMIAVESSARGATLVAIGARAGWPLRLGVAVVALAGLLALAMLLGRRAPAALALGIDGRYSSSTWQMLMWFAILFVAYASTLALRTWAGGAAYAGGVAIPPGLLALAGLSALTFAGARTVRHIKERRAAAGTASPPVTSRPRFPADLVRDGDGPPDLPRFQMVVVTVLAAGIYIVRVFHCLGRIELACAVSLPDVDTAILGGLGISHGAYLAGKILSPLERTQAS